MKKIAINTQAEGHSQRCLSVHWLDTPNLTRKRQMVLTCVGRTLVLASNERAALRRESNGEHFKSPVQTRCKSGNLHFPQIHWEIRCHSTPCSANCGPWHQEPDDMPWWSLSDWAGTQDRRKVFYHKVWKPLKPRTFRVSEQRNFIASTKRKARSNSNGRDWHQNSGYFCCQNSGWIGSTLTFPEAILPISSRKCTNPPILIQFPCTLENFMYSCQQRAGGSLRGIFFNKILTFFRRLSWWVEIPCLKEGKTHAALCYLLSYSCLTCWWC